MAAMSALRWMLGAGLTGWLFATLLSPVSINPAAWIGVLGPLLSASLTWLVIVWTWTTRPERLTHVMLGGLAAKLVAYPLYIAVALRNLSQDAMVFVASFVTSFIAMHAIEAWCLKRLLANGSRLARQ
jgi:hypothetical protein